MNYTSVSKQTSVIINYRRGTLNSHNYLTKQIQDRLVIKLSDQVSGVIKNIDIIDEKIGSIKLTEQKCQSLTSFKRINN